jgi:hypothetical protein
MSTVDHSNYPRETVRNARNCFFADPDGNALRFIDGILGQGGAPARI